MCTTTSSLRPKVLSATNLPPVPLPVWFESTWATPTGVLIGVGVFTGVLGGVGVFTGVLVGIGVAVGGTGVLVGVAVVGTGVGVGPPPQVANLKLPMRVRQ